MEKIKIIVDTREMNSWVVKRLFEFGVEIETKMLKCGDFILSEEVGVERKNANDFLKSIIDGRIFKQAESLIDSFKKPLILIEGIEDIYHIRNIHPNAIRGALSSLCVDFGIPIIYSKNEEDSAQYLYLIAKREQIQLKKEVNLRGERKPLGIKELQEYIVAGLPNVGIQIAKNLLSHFKTIEKIFTASEKELSKVKGVGKGRSKLIRRILTKEYE